MVIWIFLAVVVLIALAATVFGRGRSGRRGGSEQGLGPDTPGRWGDRGGWGG